MKISSKEESTTSFGYFYSPLFFSGEAASDMHTTLSVPSILLFAYDTPRLNYGIDVATETFKGAPVPAAQKKAGQMPPVLKSWRDR